MDLDDDSDDSSSPETLDQFREKWQQELVQTKKQQRNQTSNQLYNGNFVDKNNQQVLNHGDTITILDNCIKKSVLFAYFAGRNAFYARC